MQVFEKFWNLKQHFQFTLNEPYVDNLFESVST